MVAENATTILIGVFALAIVGVGFFRARPYGKLGILAWLQSVVLMAPWLLFFGLFAFGIYLNVIAVLLLFVLATGVYVLLGRQLRALGQDKLTRDRLERLLQQPDATQSPTGQPKDGDETASPGAPAFQVSEFHPIPNEDLQAIKGIFGVDTFFATETIPYQQGAIFKGNLRGEPAIVQPRLAESLQARLGDRYRLFLINGPEERPVVVILPTQDDPKPAGVGQWVLAGVLLVATVFTVLERGALQLNFDLTLQPGRWLETLPVGLGLLAVLAAHEVGHIVAARKYGVRLSPPFLIPAWQLGSYGAITKFDSFLPNRSVLFDVAFAGPAAGGLLSLLMLVGGLALSIQGGTIEVPTVVLEGSMIVGVLSRTILGAAEVQADFVQVHPLVIVGWLGLVINGLNLLPAGQLDGGRILQAIYGRKVAGRVGFVTLVLLAIASLANPVALYWAVLILFVQRQPERPNLDELTEPNDTRAALCLLGLLLVLGALLPLTPSLAGQLGIGLQSPQLLPL